MKAVTVFMVVCMILFSALAGSGELLQNEIQNDCCQQMGENMHCPHQKQDCGNGLCNLRVCHMPGFTAVNPVTVKLFKPLLKRSMISMPIIKDLFAYSATFWHPPQV